MSSAWKCCCAAPRTAQYPVPACSAAPCTIVAATIIIGGENDFLGMQECSVITTPYRIGDRQAGYLGVVGPTRMNYDRAVAAVGLMAQSLSQMLTHLSLS